MADIRVRPYRSGDLPEVLQLLRLALGESPLLRRTPEWFSWKHRENPFGPSLILVATLGTEIVGLRAFMRWQLVAPGGARLSCARAVDTATHPAHQRRGIFRRLTEAALERAREAAIDLVFNTPNPRSGAGYLTMGWEQVGGIGIFLRAHPSRLLQRPAADALPDSSDFARAEPVNGLQSHDRAPRGLRTPRTDQYLTWRFTRHPTARYLRVDTEGGTAILRPNYRRGRRELVLADLFGPRPGRAARAAGRRSRAAYMVAWFSRGSPERQAILRAGFLPVPRVRALTLMARPLRSLGIEVGRFDVWDLALSDLELL
jgi:GNAT superfamily N-acetyltransferase